MKILVLAEKKDMLNVLCSGARKLGDQIEAVLISTDVAQGKEISSADKVWFVPVQNDRMIEDYTETIAALVEKEKPSFFIVEPTKRLKLMAGRMAALMGASVITDVMELTKEGQFKRMVYGGAGVRNEQASTETAIVTLGAGVLERTSETRDPQVETVDVVEPKLRVKVISRQQKQKSSVNLNKSKRVVGVGRGIAKEEDLAKVREFAEMIDAEVGCSRPIAEGEKWMPKETYIGVSGLMLSPDVYFALGISGQVQHVVGINRSKTVIAVNKDKNAPIFKQADYGIVGDLYKVVPALINHLK